MEMRFDIQIKKGKCFVNGLECDLKDEMPLKGLSHIMTHYLSKFGYYLDGVYNKGLYWPDEVQFAIEWTLRRHYRLEPTEHLFDRLYQYKLPRRCYTAMLYGEVVEAEFEHGVVKKIVTRLPNKNIPDEDLCAAIVLENDNGEHIAKVLTMWVNNKWDRHCTLREENYKKNQTVVKP